MYIETTNENLFSKEDIYESLISHCGLEYASSVFRLLGANKEFEFDENMPAKWQILISLGQQTILQMQESNVS